MYFQIVLIFIRNKEKLIKTFNTSYNFYINYYYFNYFKSNILYYMLYRYTDKLCANNKL